MIHVIFWTAIYLVIGAVLAYEGWRRDPYDWSWGEVVTFAFVVTQLWLPLIAWGLFARIPKKGRKR